MGIIRYRRMLRAAIAAVKEGREEALPMKNGTDPAALTGPVSNDALATGEDLAAATAESDAARRVACPWDAHV